MEKAREEVRIKYPVSEKIGKCKARKARNSREAACSKVGKGSC